MTQPVRVEDIELPPMNRCPNCGAMLWRGCVHMLKTVEIEKKDKPDGKD